MELEGRTSVEGESVDRVNGLEGVRAEIAMVQTPDGHSKLELTRYDAPPLVAQVPAVVPPNTLGFRNVMFAVEDIHDVVERMRPLGGDLVGEIVRFQDIYLLCYLRGPAGIIVALAEAVG